MKQKKIIKMKDGKDKMTDAQLAALLKRLRRLKPPGLTLQEWLRRMALYLEKSQRREEREQEKRPIEALKERLASRKPIGRIRIRIL